MQTPEQRATAERLRGAFDAHDAGVALMRATLRRAHPDADEPQLERLLDAWLCTRPGAEAGDADGIPRPIPPGWR